MSFSMLPDNRTDFIGKAVMFFFTAYFFLAFFFVEDFYGSVFEGAFPLFTKFAGFSVLTLTTLVLGIALFLLGHTRVLPAMAKKLILQVVVMLLLAYTFAFFNQRGASAEGSGLMELRAFFNFTVFVYLWSVCLRSEAAVRHILAVFQTLSLISCTLFLLLYFTPLNLFSVDNYGKSIMFESSIIFFWCFCYNLFLCRFLLQKQNRTLPLLLTAFLFLCILLTLRRGFILLLLVSTAVMLFLFFFKKHKLKFLLFLVIGGTAWVFLSGLFGARYNFFALLDTSSESYETALSSNLGHTLDIVFGLEQALAHPLVGLGPGTSFTTGLASEDFIVSSMIHCQPLHFWLRLGLLGLLFIVSFYARLWRHCWRVTKISAAPFYKRAAAAVLGFMAGHFVSSFFTPPFYVFEKQLLFFSFLFSLVVALRQQTGESVKLA